MKTPIPVFLLDDPEFEANVRRCSDAKRNFIIVGDSQQGICARLSKLIDLQNYCPDVIHRWGIYALADVLAPDQINQLLQADRAERTVCIVEQLKLPTTRPPYVKPVIVYSEPQGVIADVETVEAAKKFLVQHENSWSHLKKFPLAGIYQWEDNEWHKARVFV